MAGLTAHREYPRARCVGRFLAECQSCDISVLTSIPSRSDPFLGQRSSFTCSRFFQSSLMRHAHSERQTAPSIDPIANYFNARDVRVEVVLRVHHCASSRMHPIARRGPFLDGKLRSKTMKSKGPMSIFWTLEGVHGVVQGGNTKPSKTVSSVFFVLTLPSPQISNVYKNKMQNYQHVVRFFFCSVFDFRYVFNG